jgi:hypothetical protein
MCESKGSRNAGQKKQEASFPVDMTFIVDTFFNPTGVCVCVLGHILMSPQCERMCKAGVVSHCVFRPGSGARMHGTGLNMLQLQTKENPMTIHDRIPLAPKA